MHFQLLLLFIIVSWAMPTYGGNFESCQRKKEPVDSEDCSVVIEPVDSEDCSVVIEPVTEQVSDNVVTQQISCNEAAKLLADILGETPDTLQEATLAQLSVDTTYDLLNEVVDRIPRPDENGFDTNNPWYLLYLKIYKMIESNPLFILDKNTQRGWIYRNLFDDILDTLPSSSDASKPYVQDKKEILRNDPQALSYLIHNRNSLAIMRLFVGHDDLQSYVEEVWLNLKRIYNRDQDYDLDAWRQLKRHIAFFKALNFANDEEIYICLYPQKINKKMLSFSIVYVIPSLLRYYLVLLPSERLKPEEIQQRFYRPMREFIPDATKCSNFSKFFSLLIAHANYINDSGLMLDIIEYITENDNITSYGKIWKEAILAYPGIKPELDKRDSPHLLKAEFAVIERNASKIRQRLTANKEVDTDALATMLNALSDPQRNEYRRFLNELRSMLNELSREFSELRQRAAMNHAYHDPNHEFEPPTEPAYLNRLRDIIAVLEAHTRIPSLRTRVIESFATAFQGRALIPVDDTQDEETRLNNALRAGRIVQDWASMEAMRSLWLRIPVGVRLGAETFAAFLYMLQLRVYNQQKNSER